MTPLAWLKIGGTVAVVILVAFAFNTVLDWKADAARVPVLEQQVTDANASITRLQDLHAKQVEISNAYQDDLERIRSERDRVPARTVRLCRGAELPEGGTAGAAGGSHAPASQDRSGAHGSDHSAGPDIGPELYDFADDSAANAAQVTRLHEYVRSLRCR